MNESESWCLTFLNTSYIIHEDFDCVASFKSRQLHELMLSFGFLVVIYIYHSEQHFNQCIVIDIMSVKLWISNEPPKSNFSMQLGSYNSTLSAILKTWQSWQWSVTKVIKQCKLSALQLFIQVSTDVFIMKTFLKNP